MPASYKQISAVVADGATTSGAVDLTDLLLCGVYIPADVEGTTLTFTVSTSSAGTYLPLWDTADAVVSHTIDATGCYLALDPAICAGIQYAKVVLGTAQSGAVTLTLIARPG